MTPLSWSEFSLYERDREAWHKKYILGLQDPPTSPMRRGTYIHEMLFTGKKKPNETSKQRQIHDRIEEHYKMLQPYPFQHEVQIHTEYDGIPLLGYLDGYNRDKAALFELKTGGLLWTEEQVDNHDQLHFYSILLMCQGWPHRTTWLGTAAWNTGTYILYERTANDVRKFALLNRIEKVVSEMKANDLWKMRLGSHERITL